MYLTDISIEQVAALGAENKLPIPSLNLDALSPSTSAFSTPYTVRPSAPGYLPEDPWNFPRNNNGPSDLNLPRSATTVNGTSTLSGSGLPRDWWKRLETVTVTIQGQQGHLLHRYTVYEITTDVSPT